MASSGYMAAYYNVYQPRSVPVPPPPDIQPIIDKTAAYVAKNGPSFEKTVLEKHVGDPRFDFLSPWSRYHGYYQAKVQEDRQRLTHGVHGNGANTDERKPAEEKIAAANLQRLSHGAVRFTIAPKPVRTVQPGVDLGGEEEEEGGEGVPEAKRPRTEQEENGEDKMDGKIQVGTTPTCSCHQSIHGRLVMLFEDVFKSDLFHPC